MGSNEPNSIHSNLYVLQVLTIYKFTTNVYYLQIVFSQGDDESDGVIWMSPGNGNVNYQPPAAPPHWDQSHGAGFGWCSPLMYCCSGHQGPWPWSLLPWTSLSEAQGCRAGRYVCIHTLFPLLLDNHVRVMLEGDYHPPWRHCWHSLPLIMEGVSPRSGLSSTLESHLCHSSSFCTWSSQDMEGDWLSSMASLKAICQALRLFHHFIPWGPRGCRQFSIPGAWWVTWRPASQCLDVPFLTLWLCHSLTPCLLLDSLQDRPPCFVILGLHLSHSWVLSPIFILRPALYPFKERSTDICNVVMNPIIQNFSPPNLGALHHPRGGRDLNCGEPCFWKAQQPPPRSLWPLVPNCPYTLHHCSRRHIAEHKHIVILHTPGGSILYGCHDWPCDCRLLGCGVQVGKCKHFAGSAGKPQQGPMSRPSLWSIAGGPWGWHSIGPQPMQDSHTCPSWTTPIHTIPRDQWWDRDKLQRPFTCNYTLPATEPLPSPAYVWPHAGEFSEAHAPFLFFGWLVCPIPVVWSVEGSSSGILFSLTSCNLNSHVTHLQFIWGSSHPSGWSGGCLRISDWRALTVQIHGDGWGKISTGMGICVSSTLFWFLYLWWGDGLAPANACFHVFLS